MSAPLIRAEGLVQRFGGVVAIDQVAFELAHGETLGVIGPNGAGKSTLVGLISGALRPSAGRIWLNGADITKLPAPERARMGIGRTYQIPRPFLRMTVQENLLAARLARHPFEPAAAARAACAAILERCGLANTAHSLGAELPLLRRKRLEVARALALEPKLLLLDEVGAGLVDSELSELIQLIHALRTELSGLIIVEHVLRVVRECCTRLLVINFGKQLAAGPTPEVLASERVAAVYLGTASGRHDAPSAAGESADQVPNDPASEAPLGEPNATPPLSTAAADQAPSDLGSETLLGKAKASSPLSAATLLELRDVHAQHGQARVLHGISLRVRAGEAVALLGSNGAGKSSLAQVIAGLLRPSSGAVLLDGRDVSTWQAHRIARAGIAQCLEGRRIFATLSVEENLLLPARDTTAAERAARMDHVYAIFPDLRERRSQSGTSLSGGQQQMLAIGRALMSKPRLIVFDEISLGLAPIMMDRLYAALADLHKSGIALLIIEQDVERALALADSAHVIEHGKLALSGRPSDLQRDPRLRQLYIGGAG